MLVLLLCMVCPQNGTAVVLLIKGLHSPPKKEHTDKKRDHQRNNTPPVVVCISCCTAGISKAHQAVSFFILDNNSGGGEKNLVYARPRIYRLYTTHRRREQKIRASINTNGTKKISKKQCRKQGIIV